MEDKAFFATTSIPNAPAALYPDATNLTTPNVANSANGGSLSYADLLNVMAAARRAKATGPFVWICSPRTLYSRITSLADALSRPIFQANEIVQRLFGYNIYDSTWIQEDLTNGSGTNQSWLLFTNLFYLWIAESAVIESSINEEFLFSTNQTVLRAVHREDFGWAPKKDVAILKGINSHNFNLTGIGLHVSRSRVSRFTKGRSAK